MEKVFYIVNSSPTDVLCLYALCTILISYLFYFLNGGIPDFQP